MTPEQQEQIIERATDLIHEINPAVERARVLNSVQVYVKYLSIATAEIIPQREITLEEMIEHDAAVGMPDWERIG